MRSTACICDAPFLLALYFCLTAAAAGRDGAEVMQVGGSMRNDLSSLTMEDVRQIYRRHEPKPVYRHRFFSVLIPFIEKDGELNLLFEVRAKDMKSDPGEICFPGGHVEPGEDPEHCALREMAEETGISQDQVTLIGPGDVLYGYANYTMYSYIGAVPYEAYQQAKIQEEEVDELFLMPVRRFMEQGYDNYVEDVRAKVAADFPYEKVGIDHNYPWRYGRWPIPVFDLGERVIWGLTAQMVISVLQTLYAAEEEQEE